MTEIDQTTLGNAKLNVRLRCIECGKEYPIDQVLYRCTSCDGLLDVWHDMDAIRRIDGKAWRNHFDTRYRSHQYPYSSGVWAKKEWVLPGIADEDVVSLGEGATPCQSFPRYAAEVGVRDIFVKQCGISHTGSFKDLGMTVLVSHVNSLIRSGVNIRAVACASTGDTSAALAAYAAKAGLPTVVFLPAGKITPAQLVQPIANGAIVLSLETDFDGCMEIVRQVTADKTLYLANSMNPLRIEGQKTLALELCQQMQWQVPDWVIIPGGNLGNVSALGAGFEMLRQSGITDRMPSICLAQSAEASPMYKSYLSGFKSFEPVQARKTVASAIQIGNPVSFRRALRTLENGRGVVEEATEQEISDASALADRHGLYCDPHTGVALSAMYRLVKSGRIAASDRVVIVSTAHGLKFTEFKAGYHAGTLDKVESRYRNEPVVLPANAEAVRSALDRRLSEHVE